MRYVFILAALCSFAFADKIAWGHNYEAGLQQTKESNKIMILMFSQHGCKMCQYMHDVVFEDEEVVAYINAHYIPVELDIYKDELPKRMKAYGTPTFYFVDAKGKKISKVIGGAKAPVFLQKLQEIKRKNK